MQCKSTHHQLITMNGLQNDLCSLQHMCNVSMEWNRLYGFGYLGGIWELTIFDVFNPIIYRFRRCFDIAFKCNVIFEWWSNQLSSDIDNGMNWNENTKKNAIHNLWAKEFIWNVSGIYWWEYRKKNSPAQLLYSTFRISTGKRKYLHVKVNKVIVLLWKSLPIYLYNVYEENTINMEIAYLSIFKCNCQCISWVKIEFNDLLI